MPAARARITRPDSGDKRFKETFFLAHATDFETEALWKAWHEAVKWEQEPGGWSAQIGTLGGHPVTLYLFWARINGRLVGFWQSPGRVVDYQMIEKWLDRNCVPNYYRCSAMNFHVCIHAIEEANKRDGVVVAS